MIRSATTALLLAIVSSGCHTPAAHTGAAAPDAHSSRQSLDWAGVYDGVLPCADCPGIETRLRLHSGERFELSTRYLDRALPPQTVAGRFSWNAAGNTITLEGAGAGRQWRVGEGRLLQIGDDGSVPDWNTPTRVLTKQAGDGADAALPATLQAHRWTLRSAHAGGAKASADATVPGHAVVMRFDGDRISVQGACNQMNGRWRFDAQGRLTVGRLASTMRACAPPLMQLDAVLSAALAGPLQARLTPGTPAELQLVAADGNDLGFVGQPTPTGLHGAPTRIFLEVAEQRVPCTPALQPPTTCLLVRERRYDDKGLVAVPPGPWQAYFGHIDGYTHEPGVSNVLRIDRFTRKNVPPDEPAFVDVLDMVIESRKAAP